MWLLLRWGVFEVGVQARRILWGMLRVRGSVPKAELGLLERLRLQGNVTIPVVS